MDTLTERLRSLPSEHHDFEVTWAAFRNVVHETALDILGPSTHKHKDWFDENGKEIKSLLEEKHCLHRMYLNNPNSTLIKDAYNAARRTVHQKLRQMEYNWLSNKADEIQGYADRNDMKNFYAGLKEVYGPTSSGSSPLLSADGSSLITDKDKILECWAEHFSSCFQQAFFHQWWSNSLPLPDSSQYITG